MIAADEDLFGPDEPPPTAHIPFTRRNPFATAEERILASVLQQPLQAELLDAGDIKPSDIQDAEIKKLLEVVMPIIAGMTEAERIRGLDFERVASEMVAKGWEYPSAIKLLVDLVLDTPPPIEWVPYSIKVLQSRKAALRMRGVSKCAADASEEIKPGLPESVEAAVDDVEEKLQEVADTMVANSAASAYDLCAGSVSDPSAQLTTGIPELDYALRQVTKQSLVVIGARTGEGKSMLAGQIAHEYAHSGKCVLFLTLEMEPYAVTQRLLTRHQAVFHEGRSGLVALSLFVQEMTYLREIRPKIRAAARAARRHVDLVVVDYMQLVRCKAENRLQEVSEVSRELKSIAREMECVVLAPAQLNRAADGRRYRLTDLRETGSIEQDADAVLFIQSADIEVAKLRNGSKSLGEGPRFTARFDEARFEAPEPQVVDYAEL